MAQFDLVLRGGTVVDGGGGPPFRADVAVRDGLVAAVGQVRGRGRRELDVTGLVVAPGFVDIHTHYDGQATWDRHLNPSSWNGVTTVVMGNCGVGFAPVRTAHRDRLIELMEGVEDIPGTALHEGLQWDWETFPEFLDALGRRDHDVDIATQVPHAPLRVHVMGDRAAAREPATAEEIAEIARLAAEAVRAGALGFSTSQTLHHKTTGGEITPSYGAGLDELTAIAAAIGQTGAGAMQMVTDVTDPDIDFDMITRLLQASGRPVSFNLFQDRAHPEQYREYADFLVRMNEQGYPLRAQAAVRAIGMVQGLACTLHPFMTNPVWKSELSHLPAREQAAIMASPGMRERILTAQTDEKILNRASFGLRVHRWDTLYEFADPPVYEPSPDSSVAAIAQRSGRSPEDVAYDMLIADEGRGLIYQPFSNYAYGSLDAVREMLAHPYTVPGLSDGGAHVGTICDASFPTSLLQYWARDRKHGRLDLSFVVKRQAHDTARAVGLLDRGLLRPGYKADINVIDLDGLTLHRPEVHDDLPAGGRRLLQRVDGYIHTFVSGTETFHNGEPTREFPGRLIRGARPAPSTQ